MEAALVLEALNRALGHRQIEPDQLLIHTDQGSQYRATAYRQLIRQLAFWIDGYYNRERRHSTIGYLSPINYEQVSINTRTLTPVEP